jgi:predicted ATP-grasp superfamily ATP-dependent carboligase
MTQLRVLVLGAEEHQGLAVIRGLGLAGVCVIAGGARRHSLGFYSRYAARRARYRSPHEDPDGFRHDVLDIVRRTQPDVVLPALESTLAAADPVREKIQGYAEFAAAPRPALDVVIDKLKTVRLAQEIGVPVPRTAWGRDRRELLARAASLGFPVAIKPRGHALWATTAHRVGFKVTYARSCAELSILLDRVNAGSLLVQEYAPGTGCCVAAVCDDGAPLAMMAYARIRELPLTGGVSVMRRTIPLDPRMESLCTALLAALRWHGAAMIEFKHDAASDHYTLIEMNGRFQASTALAIDAGLNMPYLTASLFAGRPTPVIPAYAIGMEERWLRGDLLALLGALRPTRTQRLDGAGRACRTALRAFCSDFHAGVRYDEFRRDDWRPGLVEFGLLLKAVAGWTRDAASNVVQRSVSRLTGAARSSHDVDHVQRRPVVSSHH